jgi:hypothetical protein
VNTLAPERHATSRKSPLWIVVGALLFAAAALWISARLTWSFAVFGTADVPLPRSTAGTQHAPALIPLAVFAVAGIAGALATNGWPRRVVGSLLVLAGLAAVWTGIDGLPGVFGAKPAGFPIGQILTGRGLAVLAGIGMVLAGVILVRAGARLRGLGGGYRTPAARAKDPDKELWQTLSDGADPTVGEDPHRADGDAGEPPRA